MSRYVEVTRDGTYTRLSCGPLRVRTRARILIVGACLAAVIVIAGVAGLMLGDYPLTVPQTIAALFGRSSNSLANYFVQGLRLPRILAAIFVGAALGCAGAIFQSVTRNPLGSPDITGFTVGAASGALLQILVFDGGPVAISVGAMLGGLGTGIVVFWLSRADGIHGTTFVLVGLGVSFVLQALNALLLVKASLNSAQVAQVWLAGSLNATTWAEVAWLASSTVVLLVLGCVLGRDASVLLAGDDMAAGVGVDVQRRRSQLIAIGVILTAVAVSVAGPVGFVALAAPQLARKLARNFDSGFVGAALMGAVIVLVADIVGQRILAPVQLPVGSITGVIGGAYLLWLIYREWKAKGR